MKVLFLSILVIALVSARSTIHQDIYGEFPECPIDDPLQLVQAAINVTFDPVLKLVEGSSVENFILRGLRTLRYTAWINAAAPLINFELHIPQVTGNGAYKAEGYLDVRPIRQETIPSGNLTGSGLANLSATNIKILGSFWYWVNLQGKVQFSRLTLQEVSFDTLELDLGPNFLVGGEPVNWPEFNRNIKSNFDLNFAENRKAIEERIKEAFNIILKNYEPKDLPPLLPPNTKICPM